MSGTGKSGHLGRVGAGLTVSSYFRRIRVQAVGTVQITPPLPKQKMGPLAGPIFVFVIEAGLGSAKQVNKTR
jgi:hypothetical protein